MSALSIAGTPRRNLSAIRPQLMRTIYAPPLRNRCSTPVHRLLEHGASTMQAPAKQMLCKCFVRTLGYAWVAFGFPCVRNSSRAFARYSKAPSKPLPSLVPNRDRSIVLNRDTPVTDSVTVTVLVTGVTDSVNPRPGSRRPYGISRRDGRNAHASSAGCDGNGKVTLRALPEHCASKDFL
jgi:hypothetical protein